MQSQAINFKIWKNMLIQIIQNSPEPELLLAWLDMLDLHASDEVTSGLPQPSTCSALKRERHIIKCETSLTTYFQMFKPEKINRRKGKNYNFLYMSSDIWNVLPPSSGSFLPWRWRQYVHLKPWQVSKTLQRHIPEDTVYGYRRERLTYRKIRNIRIISHNNPLWISSF